MLECMGGYIQKVHNLHIHSRDVALCSIVHMAQLRVYNIMPLASCLALQLCS